MNSELLQTYDHYLYALVAMVGTGMGVIGLQWLMRYSRWAAWVRSLAGVAPPFINIIGVLFGLTLAFLANDTWSAHDRATNAVFREADALRSLVTLSASLPEPLQGRVRAAVVSYGQASAAEWPLLARRQSGAEVPQRADALLKLLASRDIASALPDTVHALMLRKVSDIQGERDQRIGLSQNPCQSAQVAGHGFSRTGHAAVAGGGACGQRTRSPGGDGPVCPGRRAHGGDYADTGQPVPAAGSGVARAD